MVEIQQEELDKFHICDFQAMPVHFSIEFFKAYTCHGNWQVLLSFSMSILEKVH
jgi:hypothetical protein